MSHITPSATCIHLSLLKRKLFQYQCSQLPRKPRLRNVSRGTLNPTHSLTRKKTENSWQKQRALYNAKQHIPNNVWRGWSIPVNTSLSRCHSQLWLMGCTWGLASVDALNTVCVCVHGIITILDTFFRAHTLGDFTFWFSLSLSLKTQSKD